MVGRVIANSSLGLPSPCGVVPQVPILVKRTITTDEKIMSREVVVEKTTNGKESLKITIKAPTLRGGGQAQAKIAKDTAWQPKAPQLVGPVHTTDQTGLATRHPTSPVRLVPHTGQTGPRVPG
jgi:hypothetical protein